MRVPYNLLPMDMHWILFVQDARRKAMNKRIEFPKYFQKSDFDAAINCLCEVLILMPRIPALNAELMNIYWQRAECYRRKVGMPL